MTTIEMQTPDGEWVEIGRVIHAAYGAKLAAERITKTGAPHRVCVAGVPSAAAARWIELGITR